MTITIKIDKSAALGGRFKAVVGTNYVTNATPSQTEQSFEKATGQKLKTVRIEDAKLRAAEKRVLDEAQVLIRGL